MKIVYIGDFNVFYSSERYVADALKQLGHEVVELQENSRFSYEKELVAEIKNHKPDFVLFCKARTLCNPFHLIERLKEEGLLTVAWLFDLYWELITDGVVFRSVYDPPFKCDMVFTTDGGHDKEWKEIGVDHYLLRQGIHEPDAFYGDKTEGVPEVVFVGTRAYNQRAVFLEKLKNMFGSRFGLYGPDSELGAKRGKDLNDLFASTKVVVGDSQPRKNYWSNRIYETLGRGGFLIHPGVEGLESEFEAFKHYVPYHYGDIDQLVDVTEYFLKHDEEREKIRKAGHELVKKNYTYTKRCERLTAVVSERLQRTTQKNS
jgi:hypothetical protein